MPALMGYLSGSNSPQAANSNEVDVTADEPAGSNETPMPLKEYSSFEFRTSADMSDWVGCGSFSTVIRCDHQELKTVVVKCFNGLTGSTRRIKQKLKEATEEAQKLCNIAHENIVMAFGATSWQNNFGIIMEEVKGGNLDDLLFDKQIVDISWKISLRIILQINEALIYLHSENRQHSKKACVHGDLKPQNILLTVQGMVKVGDFGTAEIAITTGISNSSINFAVGKQYTLIYTAPEFFQHKKSCASDIYSLGMMTYEVLTRRQVYEGIDPRRIHTALIAGSLCKPKMDEIDKIELQLADCDLEIFQGVKQIMVKCWKDNANERLNATQVGRHIDDIMKSEKVSLGKEELASIRMPRGFRMNATKNCGSAKKSTQISLCQFNVFSPCSTYQKQEPERRKQKELSDEGSILLVKKGKVLKFETKSKKLKELQGPADLSGKVVKKDNDIYVVSCESRPQTIEKLQVDNDQWSSEEISSHVEQERSQAAFATYGNFLFVVGGSQKKTLCTGERYDLETGQWRKIRDMTSNRSGHALVEVEGYLYAIGGFEMSSAERFDVDPETEYEGWSVVTAMTHERYGLAVVEMNDKIYAIGGCDNKNGKVLRSVEFYDIEKETWEKGVSMTKERCWHGACRVGHKIYVAGGESNVIESYNPTTSEWTIEAVDDAFKGVHSMFSI